MAILSKEQILEAQDITTEEVAVPEWGGSVLVRSLTGNERNKYEMEITKLDRGGEVHPDMTLAKEKLLVLSIVDDGGELLFSQSDLKALAKKNAAVIDRLFDVSMRLSGLSASDMEELTKNSEAAPNGSSGSD